MSNNQQEKQMPTGVAIFFGAFFSFLFIFMGFGIYLTYNTGQQKDKIKYVLYEPYVNKINSLEKIQSNRLTQEKINKIVSVQSVYNPKDEQEYIIVKDKDNQEYLVKFLNEINHDLFKNKANIEFLNPIQKKQNYYLHSLFYWGCINQDSISEFLNKDINVNTGKALFFTGNDYNDFCSQL